MTRDGYYTQIAQAFEAAWANSKTMPPPSSPRFEGGTGPDDKAKIYDTCQVDPADPSRPVPKVCILEVDPEMEHPEFEVAAVIDVLNDCLYNTPPPV